MLMFMPDEAGDLIGGRYLLAEPVSHGGLGQIWRGHDQLLDREVAVTEIPLPPRPGLDRANVVDDLMREVRTAARLGGRAGIMVHDVAEHADALWIVTQPGDGESLAAEITRIGRREAGSEPPAAPATAADRAASGPVAPSAPTGLGIAGQLTAAMRANTGLTVGVATGIVMILALILVVVLFPSRHHPTAPPRRPAASSTASTPSP
jgi:hypothetical protein